MTLLLIFVALAAALGIAWSDFLDREIHIVWFALLGLSGVGYQMMEQGMSILPDLLFNASCIGIMVGSIWLLYRMKGEKQIMDHFLGYGDVVMLLVLGIWLPPLSFLLLFTSTCFLLILGMMVLRMWGKVKADYPIPLAGALGIAFLPASYFIFL